MHKVLCDCARELFEIKKKSKCFCWRIVLVFDLIVYSQVTVTWALVRFACTGC